MKKNAKQYHTAGSRRKSRLLPPVAPGCATVGCALTCSESRKTTSITSTDSITTQADAASATRHDESCVMPTTKIGASAHPTLPEMPCAAYACPSRVVLTRALMIEKSTGWNTQLPTPASAMQATSIA